MKYTVVIPLYNKEHCIEKTLRSVLDQTYPDFDVVVVDDGSSDQSLANARKVTSEKIRIISQENQGVSVARNTGIEQASGTYIAFLDADDAWREDYLETIDKLVGQYPQSDIFVTAYAVHLGKGKVNLSARLTPPVGCLDSYWLTLAKGYDFVWTSATTIRKQALVNAGLFKPGEKIGQDLDMWARVARNNPKVAYASAVCVDYHRMAESNARSRVKIARAEAFIRDLEEELENPERTREERASIQWKYDKKMTVFIFTAILAGEKKWASAEIRNWKGEKTVRNRMLRMGLRIAAWLPCRVNQWAYAIRLRVF